MNKLKIVFLSLFIFAFNFLEAQTNTNCGNATPFCTGQTMNFPASVNAPPAQSGPYYGCLFSQPNPAWFFMQIANSGSMSIAMSANNDIDFICWGPFSSLAGACNSLTSGNMQSCSYSGSATETCTIANAIAGQFYLLLITNYSNSTQNITFNQNNAGQPGAASTNCGFVCVVTPTTSGMVCAGQTITLSLAASTSSAVTSYTWFGPSSYSSTNATNYLFNVQSNATYTVKATASSTLNSVPYSGTCSAVISTSVIQYPTYSITPTTTNICQGGNFLASVTFTPASNPANYSYQWAPGVLQPSVSTMIWPPLLPTTVTMSTLVYSVTVWPTNTTITCPVTKTLEVTINNPLTPSLTVPAPLCDIFSPIQLQASPGGGTWTAIPAAAVSPGGNFTPSLATIGNNPVFYAVSVNTCIVSNSMAVSVSKFNTPALSNTLNTTCVQDPLINLLNIVQSTVTGVWTGTQVSSNIFNPANLPTNTYSLTYNTVSLPNPTVCPASTVLAVYVFNPPVPVIDPIYPKCTNASSLSLTATPVGGVWSGNSGININGVQTPSNCGIGTNTVLYTAGLGTCVASSVKAFHVSQYNSPALTGTVPHLCANNGPFNLMSIVQNTNGAWSGQGVGTGTSFVPSGLPTNTYNVTYQTHSSPNFTLCPDTSNIAVYVLNPPTPNIVQPAPVCSTQNSLQLTVSPNTGTWTATSFLTSGGLFNPTKAAVGSNPVQYIIGTPTCFAQQTKSIEVEAFVSAAITSSIGDLCTTNSPLVLSPFTLSNLGTWSGVGIVGSSFNPGISGAGKFILTHHTSSSPSALCPDQATVAVQVYSLAAPSIKQEGPFCDNSMSIQFMVSPVGGIFNSGVLGMVSSSGLFHPSMARIGENIVTYSISSGPCIANITTTVSVEKFVSADLAKNLPLAYCRTDESFNLNSFVINPGGFWSGPGTNVLGMFDPAKAEIGNNLIKYETHSEPSFLLCPDHNEILIKVKDVPTLSLQSTNTSGCAPFTFNIAAQSNELGNITWFFGDGSTEQNSMTVSHVFAQPGSYSIMASYVDAETSSCVNQMSYTTPVIVNENPKADFIISPEEVSIVNPEINLKNISTILENNKYTWTIQGLGQFSEMHPQVYLPQAGIYKITLQAATVEGCVDETIKYVEVKNDFSCYIPNSFTPNFDGINDVFIPVFSPYGLDQTSFKMEIFDRWGHELYATKDVTKGWNGSYKNEGDSFVKQDIYLYKVHFKDLEGKAYSRIGNVSVIK